MAGWSLLKHRHTGRFIPKQWPPRQTSCSVLHWQHCYLYLNTQINTQTQKWKVFPCLEGDEKEYRTTHLEARGASRKSRDNSPQKLTLWYSPATARESIKRHCEISCYLPFWLCRMFIRYCWNNKHKLCWWCCYKRSIHYRYGADLMVRIIIRIIPWVNFAEIFNRGKNNNNKKNGWVVLLPMTKVFQVVTALRNESPPSENKGVSADPTE